MKLTDSPIIVTQTFSVSKERVWQAITELPRMKQWYFENIPSFQPEVGFTTRFVVENAGRVFPHVWEVVEVIPNNTISYNWHYEGDSVVTFDIQEKGTGVELTVTHRVTEDFPNDIPEFKPESCLAGWKYFIQERLTEYLKTA